VEELERALVSAHAASRAMIVLAVRTLADLPDARLLEYRMLATVLDRAAAA
jgi:hypothetical protein